MSLFDFPWLIACYKQLVSPLLQGRAHHALLFHYIEGSGEDLIINQYIKRLLCQHAKGDEPCQVCHSCQLFDAENHPDFHLICCDKNRQSISVEQIRSMTTKVYEKSQQGGNKVIWIKEASLMTEAAANALLKTVEEPPEMTYFILSDDHNRRLLPTIHSRCSYAFLSIPTLDNSIAWLKERVSHYSDNELATALLLNENAPFAAAKLLTVEKWQQRKLFCDSLLTTIPENNYWLLAKQVDSEQFTDYIHWFCSLLSDALKAKQRAGRFIINRDQVPLVRLLARNESEHIIQLYSLWRNFEEKLLKINGLNKELIIHNVLAQSELVE